MRIEEIKIGSYSGKRLRGELLVYLKENGGLTYREIAEISLFSDVRMSSLGKMYRDARLRIISTSLRLIVTTTLFFCPFVIHEFYHTIGHFYFGISGHYHFRLTDLNSLWPLGKFYVIIRGEV